MCHRTLSKPIFSMHEIEMGNTHHARPCLLRPRVGEAHTLILSINPAKKAISKYGVELGNVTCGLIKSTLFCTGGRGRGAIPDPVQQLSASPCGSKRKKESIKAPYAATTSLGWTVLVPSRGWKVAGYRTSTSAQKCQTILRSYISPPIPCQKLCPSATLPITCPLASIVCVNSL